MAKNQEVLSKAQEQLDYATSRCGNLMEQLDKIRDQMKWHRGQDIFKSEENLVDARGDNKEKGEGVQSAEDTDELTESDLSHSVDSRDNSSEVGKKFDQIYKKFSKDPRSTHNLSRSSSSYESLATSEHLSIKSISTDREILINKVNEQSNEMEGDGGKYEKFGDLRMEAMDNVIYGEDEIMDDVQFKKELEAYFDDEEEEEEEEEEENGDEKIEMEDIQGNFEGKDVSDENLSEKYDKETMEKEKTLGMYHYRRESIGNDERQEENEDEQDMGQKYETYHDLDQEKAEYNFVEENLDHAFDKEESFYEQTERDSSISLDTDRSSLDEDGIFDKIIDTIERDKNLIGLNEKQSYDDDDDDDDDQVTQEVIIKLNFDKEKATQRVVNDKSLEVTKSKKKRATQNEVTGKFQKNISNLPKKQKEPANKQSKLLEKARPNTKDSKIMKTEAIKKDLTMQSTNIPSKIAQEELSVLPSPLSKASTDKITKGKKKMVPTKKNNENVNNNNVQNSRLIGKQNNMTKQQQPAQQQREVEKPYVENFNTLKEKKDFKTIQENRKNIIASTKINNKKPVHEILKTGITEKTIKKTNQNSKMQHNVKVNVDRQNANQKNIGQQKQQPVNTVKNVKDDLGGFGGGDKNNSNQLIQLNNTDVENNIYKEKLTKLRISNKIKKTQNSIKVNGASHEIISKSLLVNIQKTLRDKLNRTTDVNCNDNRDEQINLSNGQIETVISKNLVKNKVNELNTIISKKNVIKKETLNDKVNSKQKSKEVALPKQKSTKTVETSNNNNKKTILPKEELSKVKNRTITTFSRGNPNNNHNNNPKELNMFKTFGQDENDIIVEDCRDEETLNLVATNWPPASNFDLKTNKLPHKVESAQVINNNFVKMQEAVARKGSESVQLPVKYTPLHKSGNKLWEERIPEIDNKTYIKTHTNNAEIQNNAANTNIINNNNNNNNNTKNNYYSNKDNTTQTLAQSLGFNAIPFIVGQSTSRSYHIGLNIQQTMSLMKHTPSMPTLKLGMEPSTGNISDKTSTFGSILSTSFYKVKTCPACATNKQQPFINGTTDEYNDDEEELENVDDPWYVPQKDTWDKQNIANRKRARCTCLPKNVISFNQVLNQLFQKEGGSAQIRPHSSETQVVIKSEDESEKNDQEKKMIVRPNNAFYFTRLLRNIQRIQDQYMPTTKVSFNSMKYNTL